ncbi:MAG: hypothetical protein IPJ85_07040 [Flavobacteriales bacterium]|nr:hypothetical protein [Flavobacteriales bacterium]
MEAQATNQQSASRVTVKNAGERKDLILATRPFAVEQRLRSWINLFVSAAVTTGSYLATVYVDSLWAKAAFGVLTGLSLVRLFILYHDHQQEHPQPQQTCRCLLLVLRHVDAEPA